VYHSESKFVCTNEMYVSFRFQTVQNEMFWCRLKFSEMSKNEKNQKFILSNEHHEQTLNFEEKSRIY